MHLQNSDTLIHYHKMPHFDAPKTYTCGKHCKKRRNCLLQAISPFLTMVFTLYSTYFLAHLSTTCSGGAIVTGHRPSSVRPSICPSVNNFFKNLLLQNQKANLDKTWQECSLGEALQKLLKEFNSNKNSGCHGNKMAENGKKSLKIFL